MGDISRHRDIFLNTREAIPPSLLAQAKLTVADLTYLELGNYLTDVSQFRDPVFYILAKQGIWREFVLPRVDKKEALKVARALTALAGNAAAAALLALGRPKNAALAAGVGAIPGFISNDLLAGLFGVDDWIDRMFGVPIERMSDGGKRRPEEYGYVGQFFQHFIQGITHLLFAQDITNKAKGEWGKIDRIPPASVDTVFEKFFTQYYPHEHTDQPPYVWDASERPRVEKWYAPSKRQRTLENKGGVMNVLDREYIPYLSQGLARLEKEWRNIGPNDAEGRRTWLVRLGKILHGVEDWYFHSNVVELIRLRGHKPAQTEAEDGEQFLQRFVRETLAREPEFVNADPANRAKVQRQLKRRLYRRLRFPEYRPGNKLNSGGTPSKEKSTLSLEHAYPAFPSQLDSTHTLLGALENLEQKVKGDHNTNLGEALVWGPCVFQRINADPVGGQLVREKSLARGVDVVDVGSALLDWQLTGRFPDGNVGATILDVLREWLPLVATLLSERERKRLVADVDALAWPNAGPLPAPPKRRPPRTVELEKQVEERHKTALKPKPDAAGRMENNYERAARFLHECDFLNAAGRSALEKAFKIDQDAEASHSEAPGSGGVLMQFAIKLQRALDEGDAATELLNEDEGLVFYPGSDNGAFNEVVGSHSLMSKDTLESAPFFNDATVLASVASQAVLHILLEEVTAPAGDTGLNWPKILQHLIRFPVAEGGWERRAVIFFREPENNGKIPKFADLPELARLKSARLPIADLEQLRTGKKATELEEEYVKLEKVVSHYRYP